MIRPHLTGALDIGLQKMTHFNKHNHTYQNRTGALENSVSWEPAKYEGDKVVGALIAGGPSTAKYSYVIKVVYYRDREGRLRVFEPKTPRVIRRGQPVDVNYAVFVELKGFPVLIQGIEKFKHEVADMIGKHLRMQKGARMYQFKYTGVVKDIYGGS